VDSLDDYMNSIQNRLLEEKEKKLEKRLADLEAEHARVKKLIELSLPALDREK
jgi:hypothetical protein